MTNAEEKHRERVIIYNGYNGSSIEKLKEISVDELNKKKEFYDKFSYLIYFDGMKGLKENVWWRKSFLICYMLIGLAVVIFGNDWQSKYLGVFIFSVFLALIMQREGHKTGYLDGYKVGLRDGIDKALCIDNEDKATIKEEMESIKELDRDLRLSAQIRTWEEESNKK